MTYGKVCQILTAHGFRMTAEIRPATDIKGPLSRWEHPDGRQAGVWTELDHTRTQEHARVGARIKGVVSGGSYLLRIPELKGL